ncbi:BlaI/MecI/CopY family transcriptional regulator [Iamia sp. SCSIO 61187]|nr:BlaI/MecI/CopY family transcriptional regulator [Iamia sp. SCSIO 61187]
MPRRVMGALEGEVLAVLSAAGRPVTPAEVRDALDAEVAYTTVATVLARLQAKGFVTRTPSARTYVYELAVQESRIVADRMHGDLRRSSDRRGVLQQFVGDLDPDEAAELRSLLRAAQRSG